MVGDMTTAHEQYIRRLADEVRRTWRRMDTIWPATDFAGLVLLVIDAGGMRVIRTDGAVEYAPLSDFDQRALVSGRFGNFGFTHHRGAHAPWIEIPVVDLRSQPHDREYRSFPRSTYAFALMTHESFHHYRQDGWRDLGAVVSRIERYPQDVEARRHRVETWRALRRALLEPDRQAGYLSAAAWWFQEWKLRFPDEVALVLDSDVREATAQYVDEAATVRAALGSGATADAVDRGYRRMVAKDLDPSEVYNGSADSEAYHAGSIACMLLERFAHPTWQRDAEDGVPPLESLLGTRLGRPQPPSDVVDALIEARVAPRQRRIRSPMQELMAELKTPGARFVVFEGLPATDGSFHSEGVFRVDGYDGVVFMPSLSGRYPLVDGHVTLDGAPVLTGVSDATCGLSEVALALPVPDEATLSGGRLTFRTSKVDVDVEIEAVEHDRTGRAFLCVPSALSLAGR